MKIVTANEMFRVEKLAYEKGASEETFMQNAGRGVANAVVELQKKLSLQPNVILLCGKGNNGGDAYVAGIELLKKGFFVKAISLVPLSESSPLCQLQRSRFVAAQGFISEEIDFKDAAIIVDGVYGTGFKGEVSGKYRDAIEKANDSKLPIVAIDIPSGINGSTGEIGGVAIFATVTVFLGLPKIGCFLGEAWNHIGKVFVHNFGLDVAFINAAQSDFSLILEEELSLPQIKRTRHKYEAGYVVGVAGSFGMTGAAILAGFSALRAGAGIVRILHPSGMRGEFSGAPFELIHEEYHNAKSILKTMDRASAVFIGPGIGLQNKTSHLLKKLFSMISKPCVIDADALTLIAKHKLQIPENALLTPHFGEMKRLLEITENLPILDFIHRAQEYADKKKVTLVLKGAPTFILHPHEKPAICPRGDPGMATAGSGDVLTGIIAGLLAQKKNPRDAAILGVYLHALAGELAAQKLTSYCMVATDIIAQLPEVYKMGLKRFEAQAY